MLMETKVFNERMKSVYPMVIVNGRKIDVPKLAHYLVEDLLPDDVQEVRGVDTNSSGDVIIDELWRLLLCIDDNNDTEM